MTKINIVDCNNYLCGTIVSIVDDSVLLFCYRRQKRQHMYEMEMIRLCSLLIQIFKIVYGRKHRSNSSYYTFLHKVESLSFACTYNIVI